MNFNAIGAEHIFVDVTERPLSLWKVPDGGVQGELWTKYIALNY